MIIFPGREPTKDHQNPTVASELAASSVQECQ